MKLMVIDGNSILNRAFYGIKLLSTRDGLYTNAVYGFLTTFFKLTEEEAPDYICCCFDLKAPTFRHKKFEGYKAQRKAMPDELAVQVPLVKEALDLLGIARFELEGYEADDLIGTISRSCAQSGCECVVVTGDRDSLQLVSDTTRVRLVTSRMGQTATTNFTKEQFAESYSGLTPEKIIDLKALMGDSSDNIPGVAGIGEKTAMSLITAFGSLDGVYANLESPDIRESVRKKLDAGRESAYLSYELATIDQNAPMAFSLEQAKPRERDRGGLYTLFTKLQFQSFITKLSLTPGTQAAEKSEFRALPAKRISDPDAARAYFESEASYYLIAAANLYAFAAVRGDAEEAVTLCASDFDNASWNALIAHIFSSGVSKVMHDPKALFVRLMDEGVEPDGLTFDTALAAYLLDPSLGKYPIGACAAAELGAQLLPESAYTAEDAFSPLGGLDAALEALAQHACAVRSLYLAYEPRLAPLGMEKLYYNIELPLVTVLASMQHLGFQVDAAALTEFGAMLSARAEELQKKIYACAGYEFNINSTKMLGAVLFDELGLKAIKKTKTGYSTDIDVLEKLRGQHEIIDYIIEFRSLTKLKSTYADGLLKVISPVDGRIHSTFNQMVTTTGRLSSTDPNLQNIPVRRELGSEIRRMFVAGSDDFTLTDADYSQIELRILAHIADDERMQEAFASGEDIHAVTASQVFHVPLSEVTPIMRSRAKAVNFGIVYGISAFSLADDIKVSNAEAAQYIATYLEKYDGVRSYMERVRKQAKENGYVTTLFGRRRYLPELKSSNHNLRAFGERVALNTPIQGTAADIMKIAMVNVYARLRREGLRSRLILQIHDELIVETALDERETVAALLREEMENAAHLSVRLTADVSSGRSWYEAKQ